MHPLFTKLSSACAVVAQVHHLAPTHHLPSIHPPRQDATTCSAVGLRSYNEAVEHIVVTLGAAEAAGMVTPLSSRKASTAAGVCGCFWVCRCVGVRC